MRHLLYILCLCCSPLFSICWEIGADALYFSPCNSDWTYGSVGAQESKALVLHPEYDWGFYAHAKATHGCQFAQLSWLYFDTSKSGQNGEDNLHIATGSGFADADSAKAKMHINHQRGNLRLGRKIHNNFYSFIGLLYVHIERKKEVHGLTGAIPLSQINKTEFDGGGLEVGAGATYPIGCYFSLIGELAINGFLGNRTYSASATQATSPENTISRHPSACTCIPGFEYKLAIEGHFIWSCISIAGELGYRGTNYFDALLGFSPNRQDLAVYTQQIGFAGPYVGLRIKW